MVGLPLLFGPSFLILLPAIALAVYAGWKVRSTYARYARVNVRSSVSARDTAQRILESAGVSGVTFGKAQRQLGDHYDPGKRILRLSSLESTSIAAIGVAAHEAGHAIQHANNFAPLALRTSIVPVARFGSQLAFPLFFLGLIFGSQPLITGGIILFSAAVLFTLVTLPVEFNASRRAVAALRTTGIVTAEELAAVKEVLYAAAFTYVAAAAMAALQLIMLLSAGRRRR